MKTKPRIHRYIKRFPKLKIAVSSLKVNSEYYELENIIDQVLENPFWKNVIIANTFPKDLKGLGRANIFATTTDIGKELYWSALIIKKFSGKINDFLNYRAQYEKAVLIFRVDPDTAFREIEAMVAELAALRPSGRMLGMGLAMPGPFDVEFHELRRPDHAGRLEGRADPRAPRRGDRAAAFIEVDHAAAALGERLYGAGRDFRDFYYLYFGVGLGGCMVQDGDALRGAYGNAGEIGHLPLVPDGEPCPCGNRGCLERYLSLRGLERRAPAWSAPSGWIEEAAPLLRRRSWRSRTCSIPRRSSSAASPPTELLGELIAAAGTACPIRSPSGATAPRRASSLSATGEDAVLRGAAALAVSGVLSPRFGMMFAGDEGAERDPIMIGSGARAA